MDCERFSDNFQNQGLGWAWMGRVGTRNFEASDATLSAAQLIELVSLLTTCKAKELTTGVPHGHLTSDEIKIIKGQGWSRMVKDGQGWSRMVKGVAD